MSAVAPIESFQFQAETKELLHLMIHSLYTEKEIFLRELISNASDALDRLRFEALTDPELVPIDHRYEIRLCSRPDVRTLTISDTGIGMSRQELINHLGTIARSGTQEFRSRFKETKSPEAFADLIGKFGVGFYSAFMVADQVTVITRRAGESAATRWVSAGDGCYELTNAERAGCGTDIILHLRNQDSEQGIEDYTDRWKLSLIVRKYSDFIAYPIVYEGPAQAIADGVPEAKEKMVEGTVLNSLKPVWARSRGECTKQEYDEFYKHLANDWTEPLKVMMLKAEGALQCDVLLYIPSRARHDLFYHAAEAGLRLYAKRVMVMELCQDLLPRYLRFIRGVVDCGDLPLNISRQRLQQDRHIGQIRKWLTRRVLESLAEMQMNEPDKYAAFWPEFGRALKEGVGFDQENYEKLLPLLLFESSQNAKTTLKSYVERMKPEQTEILYLTGESRKVIENSPHMEVPNWKGYEVLFLSDPVDELLVQHLDTFDGKRLKSVSKGKISVGTVEDRKELEEQLKSKEEQYAPFLQACQKPLDPYVKQVRLSTRLVGSPACLVTEEHEYSPHLERLLQKGKGGGPKQRRIMELNADHPIILRLYEQFKRSPEVGVLGQTIEILFYLSLLVEGSEIADPVRLNQLTLDLLSR